MQTATIFAFIVLGLVAMIQAQCPGRVLGPNCNQAPNGGTNRGNNCQRNAGQMWAYNQRNRRCDSLNYLGCGGNANRYCSRQECESRCIPRGPPGGVTWPAI